MYGMTFNGVKKDYVVTLRGKRRPPWAPLDRELIELPGKEGAYVGRTTVKPRPLDIPILIETKSLEELQDVKEDMADWLVTDSAKELIFEDEPDRTYFAIIDDTVDIEEIIKVGRGVLKFTCADPYKYGESDFLNPNATDLTQPILLDVLGTEATPATFEITLKDKTTYLDIIGESDYMRIGRSVNEETYAAPKFTRVLWDELGDLDGWTYNTTFNLDGTGNTPSGTITTNTYSFRPGDIGTGTGWHGPAVVKELPDPLVDFKVAVKLQLINGDWNEMGRMEIYLLDEFMEVAGKLSLRDRTTARDGNHVEARAGSGQDGRDIIRHSTRYWLDYIGGLELIREGDKWSGYAYKETDGEHHTRRYRTWRDLDTKYTRPVKYIMLHMAGYDDNPISNMAFSDLKVDRINPLADDAVPYIGDINDVFKVDMKRSAIFKNGEPFKKKDLGARFFNLNPGLNSLLVGPPSAIDNVGVNWRSRYK